MNNKEEMKGFSKEQLSEYLKAIEDKMLSSDSNLYCALAINNLLRQPGIEKSFDESSKKRAKDIWQNLKGLGLEVVDPPLLFGLPQGFMDEPPGAKKNGTENFVAKN